MNTQFDSLTFSQDQKKLLATCMCGTLSHGQLAIHRADGSTELDTTIGEVFYLTFSAVPYYNSIWRRLQNAWFTFWGQPVDVDLTLCEKDARALATWIANRQATVKAGRKRGASVSGPIPTPDLPKIPRSTVTLSEDPPDSLQTEIYFAGEPSDEYAGTGN